MNPKPRRVADRIQDMLEAIGNAESDMAGMSREEFLADGKTQRAVIESLIVIGEAGNNIMQLDAAMQQTSPALWQYCRDAYDMRIILTHEYFRVDASVVWTTVKENLPELRAKLIDFISGSTPSA